MWKMIDLSGTMINSLDTMTIEKYKHIETSEICYLLTIDRDRYGYDRFLFKTNNSADISKYHNFLKNNGCGVMHRNPSREIVMVAKSMYFVNSDSDSELFKLHTWEPDSNPFDFIENFDDVCIVETKLTDLFKEKFGEGRKLSLPQF